MFTYFVRQEQTHPYHTVTLLAKDEHDPVARSLLVLGRVSKQDYSGQQKYHGQQCDGDENGGSTIACQALPQDELDFFLGFINVVRNIGFSPGIPRGWPTP